jgi:hypothetical protein
VSFEGSDQSYRLFQGGNYNRPPGAILAAAAGVKLKPLPVFLVRPESPVQACLDSVKALCARPKIKSTPALRHLYRDASLTGYRAPGMGLANSVVLHFALLLGVLYVPRILPPAAPNTAAAFLNQEIVYYPVPVRQPVHFLPRIAPKGPGGRPGSGSRPAEVPAVGMSATHRDLTVISKPLHPDNFHQTIVQPASPPNVRIPNDLALPNIALGEVTAPKKPSFDLSFKRPSKENAIVAQDMATPVSDSNTADMSMVTSLEPRNFQPKMPMPSDTMARPTRHQFGSASAGGQEMPDIGAPGQGKTIMIIGIDPSESMARLAVPAGNRAGDFSIAPGSGNSGSPGGRSNGTPNAGNGAGGRGGDGSVGIGAGHEGGGGGKDGLAGALSIKGTGGGAALDGRLISGMVYAVPWSLTAKIPKNQMVVSAGPVGGGGLSVYGALTCGKIYTIFLPMNQASWTMQYCPKSIAPADVAKAADSSSTVIRLEAGLTPPDPEMDSRFDFKRVSVPPGKLHKMIVLRGTLREDGNVEGVEVFQGIVPQMDEAAKLAFSKWKFRPALRAGKPIALELLVGIPIEAVSGGN